MSDAKRIIVITTPGGSKKDFVNSLHQETNNGVVLAVVQKEKPAQYTDRIRKFYQKVGVCGLPSEIYHFLVMSLSKKHRQALGFTKLRSPITASSPTIIPPSMIVDDINSDEVFEKVCSLKPDIIAIWGGLIVHDRITQIPKITLNMHMGYCPYYRGTNCNLHAILHNDLEHIGVTIHQAMSKVDAGDIYSIVTTPTKRSPREFFKDLNDQAVREYVRIIHTLQKGEKLPTQAQDLTLGKNYRMKEWTYKKQHAVANMLLRLDREST